MSTNEKQSVTNDIKELNESIKNIIDRLEKLEDKEEKARLEIKDKEEKARLEIKEELENLTGAKLQQIFQHLMIISQTQDVVEKWRKMKKSILELPNGNLIYSSFCSKYGNIGRIPNY